MILSESSSISFSQASMYVSIEAVETPSCSWIFSSRSNSLIAYHLCCSCGLSESSVFSIFSSADSTDTANLCGGSIFLPLFAAFTAALAASVTPVPFSAEISTTSQSSTLDSSLIFSSSPFLRTRSIMLTAQITGIPSSSSCVVRYRLRSRFVPSRIFRIASGFSVIR